MCDKRQIGNLQNQTTRKHQQHIYQHNFSHRNSGVQASTVGPNGGYSGHEYFDFFGTQKFQINEPAVFQ